MEVENRQNSRGGSGIDGVISTQPELGPSIPDGGYGWLVLIAAIFFQCIIPTLFSTYGILLLFSKLTHGTISYPVLWDDKMMYGPVLHIIFWTISEPWNRKLILQSTWPRLVGTAGTCLLCAGLLFLWIAANSIKHKELFVLSGILTGLSSSLLSVQCEILLGQYFRLKLPIINNILEVAATVGQIMTPILLGDYIIEHGILRVILGYQAFVLQGIIVCLIFKKPLYLKARRQVYQYISNNPDDEEDVFTKDTRELQTKRTDSTPEVPSVINTGPSTSQSTTVTIEQNHKDWVKFDEDNNAKPSSTKLSLQDSFSNETPENKQPEAVFETPIPLFNDTFINNNTTYSYDVIERAQDTDEPVVFMPVPIAPEKIKTTDRMLYYFKEPFFYCSLLTLLTCKFSEFTFYTLLPSYLYGSISSLKVHQVTRLIGCLGVAGLFCSAVTGWINLNTHLKTTSLWFACWSGVAGCIVVSFNTNEVSVILGAIGIIICIYGLRYVGIPSLGLTRKGESTDELKILSIGLSLGFIIFFVINPSYVLMFKIMAALQFLTGSIWGLTTMKILKFR